MPPPDAVHGWDDDATAEAYAAFAGRYPMYAATSRALVRRAAPAASHLVVDLCGGAGTTAAAILDAVTAHTRVVSLDSSAAMQRIGRRTLTDPRLTWITAPAENLADHVPGPVDAVVCNSAIWKTDLARVLAAVHTVLRPGGRFVFNIGGGFAGVEHPDETAARAARATLGRPTLNQLIEQIAARDFAPTRPAAVADDLADDPVDDVNNDGVVLAPDGVARLLTSAGLALVDSEITAEHGTTAEKRAWLSIPVFARPTGRFTHAERMTILDRAYALTSPDLPVVTTWLIITAERRETSGRSSGPAADPAQRRPGTTRNGALG